MGLLDRGRDGQLEPAAWADMAICAKISQLPSVFTALDIIW